jgi:hypothetical protein
MRRCCYAGIVIALPVAPSPGWAQAVELAGLCFKGRPMPWCRSFLVTELGFRYQLNAPEGVYPQGLTLEAGWMRNLSQSLALGATAFATGQGGGEGGDALFSVGLKPRVRRWLGDRLSVEVSAGLAFPIGGEYGSPGITGDVGLNVGDVLQLTGSFETLRFPLGGADVAWYFGGKAGSYAGVVATVALVALGAAVAATW